MGVDLLLLLAMTALLMAVVHSVRGDITWLHRSLGLPVAVLFLMILIDFAKWGYYLVRHRENRARHFVMQIPIIVRDWTPFILIDLMYENLHDLSPHLTHYDITAPLYNFDVWLFGESPAVWAQHIHAPWLTDLMSGFYAIYLALPLCLMAFLTLSGRRVHFRQIAIAVAFTFVLGFIGYVFMPALPPRFYVPELYTDPIHLHGVFIFSVQEVWDNLAAVKGAAFPSLHVGISSTALIYAFRFRKLSRFYSGLFYAYIFLTVGLWLSTIYLRHHWIGDIFAGWCVALLATWISDKLLSTQERLRASHEANALTY